MGNSGTCTVLLANDEVVLQANDVHASAVLQAVRARADDGRLILQIISQPWPDILQIRLPPPVVTRPCRNCGHGVRIIGDQGVCLECGQSASP